MNVMGCVPRMRTHCRNEIGSHFVRTDLWEMMMTIARHALHPFIEDLPPDEPGAVRVCGALREVVRYDGHDERARVPSLRTL